MTKKSDANISTILQKLKHISAYFENEEEINIEESLKKLKEGAELIKEGKERLKETENSFKEIEKMLEE